MARTVDPARKAALTLVSPASEGWRINVPGAVNGSASRTAATLGEAAASIPLGQEIHLALPCDAALLSRLRFPATDKDELEGMVRLQLEKTLPFPPEEITSGFEIIETEGADSILVAAAASTSRLDALCQPLRDSARLPAKVTLFVMHVAAACPADATAFLVYKEDGNLVAAICEKGKPAAVQAFAGAEPLLESLPQMLMSAELAGVPTDVALVRLDSHSAELEKPLALFFGAPVELFTPEHSTPPGTPADLLPSTWRKESLRLSRSRRLKERFLLAGAIYVSLVVLAILYLAFLGVRNRALESKLERLRPQLAFIQNRQNRWRALSPAIDPAQSLVELLYQINRSLPTDSVRVTSLHAAGSDLEIDSDAPAPDVAIRFGNLLKTNPDLARYKFDISPPTIQPESTQIHIVGKS